MSNDKHDEGVLTARKSPISRSNASFTLQSDSLSLPEISALIGGESDRGWSAGEPFLRPNGREFVPSFSFWVRESGVAHGAPIWQHLEALLPRVQAIAPALAPRRDLKPTLGVVQFLYTDQQVGFHLDSDWMVLLASVGAAVDVDQYLD